MDLLQRHMLSVQYTANQISADEWRISIRDAAEVYLQILWRVVVGDSWFQTHL